MNELKVKITAETSKFKSEMDKAKKSFSELDDAAKKTKINETAKKWGDSIHKAMKIAAAAITATIAAIGVITKEAMEYADSIDKGAQKTQMSVEAYQELSYVFKQNGSDATTLEMASKKLNNQMATVAENGTTAGTVFEELGVSVLNADGSLRSTEDVMMDTIRAFEKMSDGAEKSALAVELFGKSGQDMLPMLSQTSGGMDILLNHFKEMGVELSENEIKNFVKFGDTLDDVKGILGAVGTKIASALLPYMQAIADWFVAHADDIVNTVKNIADKISAAIEFVSKHSTVLTIIGGIILGLIAGLEVYNVVMAIKAAVDMAGATSALALAGATLAALAPYLLIAAAIGAVVAIVIVCIKNWDKIKETVSKVAKAVWNKVKEMKDKVVNYFKGLWEGVKNTVDKLKTGVVEKFNSVKSGVIEKVQALKEKVKSIFVSIKSYTIDPVVAAKDKAVGAFAALKDGIINKISAARDKVKDIVDKIKGFFNFKVSLPHIKLPHFSIQPAGWKIGDLLKGSIPSLGINWYAQGGVFDSPTMFNYNGALSGLGENGAEAVVPLENNTQWLDKIAERLNQGSNTPIILQVDGTTFAKTSIKSINQLTKQTGNLGLNII